MHDTEMAPELAGAFINRIGEMGYTIQLLNDGELFFTVLKDNTEVCQFEKSGAQRCYSDGRAAEECLMLCNLMEEMRGVYGEQVNTV